MSDATTADSATVEERLFGDLPGDLPSKRAPVNRGVEPVVVVAEGWDEKPIKYQFRNQEREFFTISHLAAALGKSVVTIRSWEQKGVMPPTPYRSPRPRGNMLPDKETKGKRLWTREQILGIIDIATAQGVILNGKPPNPQFYTAVLDLYRSLLDKDDAQ